MYFKVQKKRKYGNYNAPNKRYKSFKAATTIQRAFRKRFRRKVKRTLTSMEPYKFINFASLVSQLTGSWQIVNNLTNIPYQPNETNESVIRRSTKCLVKNFYARGTVNVATGDGTNYIRLAIVRGRRAGALTVASIPDPNTTGSDFYAPFNQKFVEVVWERTITLQEQEAGSTYPLNKCIKISKPINKLCKFTQSDVTTSAQPYNNTSYYLIACTDSTLVPHPSIRLWSRVSFKDLD